MQAFTRLPVALILTDRIVDDAGLFPPEEHRPHLDIFVEVGLGPALEADQDLLQRHGHAAKVRCGAVRRELFPLPSDLARFVHHAIGREVPFKATAGLHHAIAHRDMYTGFDHFGFLNLLLAVTAAQKGAGTNEVEHILVEREPNVVLERITGLTHTTRVRSGPPSIPWAASTICGGSASSPTPPNSDDARKRRTS
jgi:hypothetical protein